MQLNKSLCLSVGWSVGWLVNLSILRSFGPSHLYFSGILLAVFASPLLPNHMWLLLSCIQHPPLPLPSRLPLLPNTSDLWCRVYGLVSYIFTLTLNFLKFLVVSYFEKNASLSGNWKVHQKILISLRKKWGPNWVLWLQSNGWSKKRYLFVSLITFFLEQIGHRFFFYQKE